MHYGAMATGGARLILVESTAVLPEGRISRDDLGLWNDDQAAAFGAHRRLRSLPGALIGIQIAHAGRKASTYAPGKGGNRCADGWWVADCGSRRDPLRC